MPPPDKEEGRPGRNGLHHTTPAATIPDYGLALFAQHSELLTASAISPEVARERRYVSVDTRAQLKRYNDRFSSRCPVPGMLIPLRRLDGSVSGYQYRPDAPRIMDGRPRKYETPFQQPGCIDVPPGVRDRLADPAVPLLVTEGSRKADSAASAGLCCVSVSGVWNWRGTNPVGGKVALPEWNDVALNGRRVVLAFDSDVTVKPAVRRALDALAGYLVTKGATVEYLHLPDAGDGKTGLDDYLAAEGAAGLWALVRPEPPAPPQQTATAEPPAAGMGPRSLFVRLPPASLHEIAGSALDHMGREAQMRKDLADATAGLLTHLAGTPHNITPSSRAGLIGLASLVSQARSPVHRDWKGEIELIGDAEAPTRIIKQLGQLWRACGVLGLDAEESWEVVRRCALDSIPKLRGAVIRYLDARTEAADTTTIGIGVVHPTRTVRRALEDLAAHGVVERKSEGPGRADRWELSMPCLAARRKEQQIRDRLPAVSCPAGQQKVGLRAGRRDEVI
jgi:hypothetical protein